MTTAYAKGTGREQEQRPGPWQTLPSVFLLSPGSNLQTWEMLALSPYLHFRWECQTGHPSAGWNSRSPGESKRRISFLLTRAASTSNNTLGCWLSSLAPGMGLLSSKNEHTEARHQNPPYPQAVTGWEGIVSNCCTNTHQAVSGLGFLPLV